MILIRCYQFIIIFVFVYVDNFLVCRYNLTDYKQIKQVLHLFSSIQRPLSNVNLLLDSISLKLMSMIYNHPVLIVLQSDLGSLCRCACRVGYPGTSTAPSRPNLPQHPPVPPGIPKIDSTGPWISSVSFSERELVSREI